MTNHGAVEPRQHYEYPYHYLCLEDVPTAFFKYKVPYLYIGDRRGIPLLLNGLTPHELGTGTVLQTYRRTPRGPTSKSFGTHDVYTTAVLVVALVAVGSSHTTRVGQSNCGMYPMPRSSGNESQYDIMQPHCQMCHLHIHTEDKVATNNPPA